MWISERFSLNIRKLMLTGSGSTLIDALSRYSNNLNLKGPTHFQSLSCSRVTASVCISYVTSGAMSSIRCVCACLPCLVSSCCLLISFLALASVAGLMTRLDLSLYFIIWEISFPLVSFSFARLDGLRNLINFINKEDFVHGFPKTLRLSRHGFQ